jgi:tripartite ATP-independent transporter DctP family solute receptor
MKRNRMLLLIALMGIALLLLGVLWYKGYDIYGDGGERIVLKAADDHELSYPTTQGLIRMGDLLKNWTNGRITVQVYHSAQLGSEKETIEQTRLGAIDINRVNINPLTQVEPALKVFSLPYLFRSMEHLHTVLDGEIGRELLGELESSGLIGLGYYDSGRRSFYNSLRPIRSPADMAGMDIRVQKAEIMQDIVRAFGAKPIKMAFEEVYTGLQTGVIQGAENNIPSWITKGHFEVAKYYSRTAHVYTPEIILFSRKTWERLSPGDQELIRRAAEESIPYQRALWREKVEESLKRARDGGCEIIADVDREAFRRAAAGIYEEHARGLEGYVEAIRAAGGE